MSTKIPFKQPDDYNFKEIENYKGFIIYEYKNLIDDINFTFWYGNGPGDYISSLKSIDEAKYWVDKQNKETE